MVGDGRAAQVPDGAHFPVDLPPCELGSQLLLAALYSTERRPRACKEAESSRTECCP